MAKITTYYRGDMLFESKIGDHSIKIDVPESMGGSDRGPMPPQLFVASLGSCVGAFVAQYCEKNDIDTTDMTIDVTFEKAAEPTRLTDLKVTVNMPHGDCGRKVKAIERVGSHCPVHMTINTMEELPIEILGEGQCTLESRE